jgi:oligopeptide/dipeptide ABC transporter ATP-binding protein
VTVTQTATLLAVDDLHVAFRTPAGVLRAVDGVSLELASGRTLGLVGESGCGKTTVARCVAGLLKPESGSISLEGHELPPRRSRKQHRAVQIVFQDPYSSLNPRLTVRSTLRELLAVHGIAKGRAAEARGRELLELVGLTPDALDRYPSAFSGGQRQRIAIARSLAVEPKVLVADEPTSALDVSIQATILALFADLRSRLGLSILLISHDLGTIRSLCDDVAVMYLGRIVESGPRSRVFEDPRHPYTRALLAAAPRLRGSRTAIRLSGEPPSPIDRPTGCPFHPRCPRAEARCEVDAPALLAPAGVPGVVACHFRDEGSA